MGRKRCLLFKGLLFVAGFYALCACLGYLLCDDADSYSRIMMHELHGKENIDVLFVGASHCAHGINPFVADTMFGKNTFSAGTSGQRIDGSYAVMREAAKIHRIEHIFVDLDFFISTTGEFHERRSLTSTYIVSHYLKDIFIKYDFLFHASAPKYYINSLLPIGVDKLIDIDPVSVKLNLGSKLSGEYYQYRYLAGEGYEYLGKGCILRTAAVKKGGFMMKEHEGAVNIKKIGKSWRATIAGMISFCEKNGIQLTFFAVPGTDFQLVDKKNYDDYVSAVRDFLAGYGYAYYDFNLCREKYLAFEDSDFYDDNHLNKTGVAKFMPVFCDFFLGNIPEEELFYSSYGEKLLAQAPKIYGLILVENADRKSLRIDPVMDVRNQGRVTYDIYAAVDGTERVLAEGTSSANVTYPPHSTGTITVVSYLDGVRQNRVSTYFNAP